MTIPGVIVRLFACFALVFATWNPSGYSYVAWAWHGPGATAPEIALAGTALLGLHILFARIAWLSLGADGISATLAVLLAFLLTLYEFDLIDLSRGQNWAYVVLLALALVLAVGVVWSLLKRRIVGQSNYLNPPP
jgi:Family of unknown function (DUF6524)